MENRKKQEICPFEGPDSKYQLIFYFIRKLMRKETQLSIAIMKKEKKVKKERNSERLVLARYDRHIPEKVILIKGSFYEHQILYLSLSQMFKSAMNI